MVRQMENYDIKVSSLLPYYHVFSCFLSLYLSPLFSSLSLSLPPSLSLFFFFFVLFIQKNKKIMICQPTKVEEKNFKKKKKRRENRLQAPVMLTPQAISTDHYTKTIPLDDGTGSCIHFVCSCGNSWPSLFWLTINALWLKGRRNSSQSACYFSKWRSGFRIRRPALFHQFSPLRITTFWDSRSKRVLHNPPLTQFPKQIRTKSLKEKKKKNWQKMRAYCSWTLQWKGNIDAKLEMPEYYL